MPQNVYNFIICTQTHILNTEEIGKNKILELKKLEPKAGMRQGKKFEYKTR